MVLKNYSDCITIYIYHYRDISKCDESFADTLIFDKECGISFVERPKGDTTECFYFKVIDKTKYFLAKIKHGI